MEVSSHHSSVIAGTVTSTYYNVILQIFCKIVTFALNGLILRYISKDLLGVVNVRLLLLHTSVLFVCREGIRRASSGNIRKNEWKQTVNLIWLGIGSSAVVATGLGLLWYFVMTQPELPYYAFGVFAYGLSSCIEMAAEPAYILAQELMYLKLRVFSKAVALTLQASFNVVFIILAPQLGILIFAVSQILGSVAYSGIFYGYFAYHLQLVDISVSLPVKSIGDLLPSSTKPILPVRLQGLSWSFTKQSLLKQFLTEGERYLMSGFQMLTFAEQGIYDVVHNLGSLVARLFFQQVEENAYILFSKVLPRDPDLQTDIGARGFGAKMLEVYLKAITAFGVILCIFGFNYSDIILMVYGGKSLSSSTATELMQVYWFYVVFLAVNGVTEAFVFSAMTRADIDRYNRLLVGLSLSFMACALVLVAYFGPVGLILANMLNMGYRIINSALFIFRYYKDTPFRPLKGLSLNLTFVVFITAIFVFLYWPLRLWCDFSSARGVILFLGSGAVSGMFVLLLLWHTENELIYFMINLLRKKGAKKE